VIITTDPIITLRESIAALPTDHQEVINRCLAKHELKLRAKSPLVTQAEQLSLELLRFELAKRGVTETET
jgi:hypothetical protein